MKCKHETCYNWKKGWWECVKCHTLRQNPSLSEVTRGNKHIMG